MESLVCKAAPALEAGWFDEADVEEEADGEKRVGCHDCEGRASETPV